MGYVATKSRLINGMRYTAGDPVDVSDWDPSLINRMEERRRILWVPDGHPADESTVTAVVEADEADEAEVGASATYEGASVTSITNDLPVGTESSVAAPVEVYHVGGGYYHRVDTGEKVPYKGKRAIRKAGYRVVDAPPGAE